MRSKAKASILQSATVLRADDAAILVLSVHTSDGCVCVKRKCEKEKGEAAWAGALEGFL